MIGLERCADCRAICTCYGECWCMVIDASSGDLTCHKCTDGRSAA